MPRQRRLVKIGPWPGGMNQKDDVRTLPDSQAYAIYNWDVEDNGALVPRRGWYQTNTTVQKAFPLCIYVASNDNSRLIASRVVNTGAGTESSKFFYTSGPAPSILTLKTAAAADIQRDGMFVTGFLYDGKIYFVPTNEAGQAAGVGFYRGSTADGDPVDVAAMPGGRWSWVMNDRAFIFHPRKGRLYWSKATDATTWLTSGISPTPGEDVGGYVDIDPNDNPFLDCIVVHDTVYFIRMDKIYTFRFSSDPSTDGQVNQIANSEGAVAGCAYNNQLVVVSNKGLFYFTNGYFTLITDKVRFTDAQGVNAVQYEYNGLLAIDHTIICSQVVDIAPIGDLTSANFRTYAVNMRTGAVSEYLADGGVLTPYGKALSDGKWTYRFAKAEDALTNQAYVIAIPHERNYFGNVGAKDDYYGIVTKMYDFDTTRSFWKRLRNINIDFEIEFDRSNTNGDLTLLYEDSASGFQGNEADITLVGDDMGRAVTVNSRFRTLQIMLEFAGGAGNTSWGRVKLRQFLASISVGEFEEKAAG